MPLLCYDLNVKYKLNKEKERIQLLSRLYALGYDCICWNVVSTGKINASLKPPQDIDISTSLIHHAHDSIELRKFLSNTTTLQNFRQLKRLTVIVDDIADAQALSSGNTALHTYDIIAACPGNIKVFAHLCKSADVDIITLDFTHRISFNINKKLVDEAIQRGIFFEITYSPMLSPSSGARKEAFANTQLLLEYLRGKRIVLSSGAESFTQIRGPEDVMNLGLVLGIHKQHVHASISENCSLLLKRAIERRRMYKSYDEMSHEQLLKRYPEFKFVMKSFVDEDDQHCEGDSGDHGMGTAIETTLDVQQSESLAGADVEDRDVVDENNDREGEGVQSEVSFVAFTQEEETISSFPEFEAANGLESDRRSVPNEGLKMKKLKKVFKARTTTKIVAKLRR
jgi:ribonuclease P/MRP protein subunit RPP1